MGNAPALCRGLPPPLMALPCPCPPPKRGCVLRACVRWPLRWPRVRKSRAAHQPRVLGEAPAASIHLTPLLPFCAGLHHLHGAPLCTLRLQGTPAGHQARPGGEAGEMRPRLPPPLPGRYVQQRQQGARLQPQGMLEPPARRPVLSSTCPQWDGAQVLLPQRALTSPPSRRVSFLSAASTLGPLNQKPGLRGCFFPHCAQFYVLAFLPRVSGGEL